MHDNNKTVAIIGASPSGLSAAYHTQKSGYHVVLLEKTDTAGGKCDSRQYKDFTVDFGPHAYNYFDEVIKKESNYIQSGDKFIVPLPEPKIIEP